MIADPAENQAAEKRAVNCGDGAGGRREWGRVTPLKAEQPGASLSTRWMERLKTPGWGYAIIFALELLLTMALHVVGDTVHRLPGAIYLYLPIVIIAPLTWSFPHAIAATVLAVVLDSFWVGPPGQLFHQADDTRMVIFGLVAIGLSMLQHFLADRHRMLESKYEVQASIAQTLQRALLPRSMPIPTYDTSFLYEPASRGAHVGGDFLDIFPVGEGDHRIGLVLGDVTGHGVEAAVETAELRFTLKAHARQGLSPAESLAAVNNMVLPEAWFDRYATVFCAILDTQSHMLTYALAGHELPLLWKQRSRSIVELGPAGLPVGVLPTSPEEYDEHSIPLDPGDVLLVYTDGITEARRDGAFFGAARLKKALQDLHDTPAEEAVRRLYARAHDYAHGDLRDDLALLWLKRPAATLSTHPAGTG